MNRSQARTAQRLNAAKAKTNAMDDEEAWECANRRVRKKGGDRKQGRSAVFGKGARTIRALRDVEGPGGLGIESELSRSSEEACKRHANN